jgi:hypothetical protein
VILLVALRHPAQAVECRASGPGADLHWRWDELGLKPGQAFNLANPLAAGAP